MEEKNKFEEMLEQFAELLRFIEQKAGTPIDPSKIPPDLKERLYKIQKDIQLFTKLGERVIALSEVPPEEIARRLKGQSEEVSPEGRRLIEKTKELHDKTKALKAKYAPGPSTLEPLPLTSEPILTKSVDDKTFRKRRKRKFKGMSSEERI